VGVVANESKTGKGEIALWIGVALACRIVFLALSPRAIDSADSIRYLEVARDLSVRGIFEFDARIPVLYPALAAFIGLAIPDPEWAAILVSMCASVLLVWPIWRLADTMHGRPTARVAALTVCLWPWLIDYGCRVSPEALMSLFWFGALWALVQTVRCGGLWPYAAALLCFGLHLTRPEGVLLWLAAPFVALLLHDRKSGAHAARLIPFAILSVTCLVLYAAYMRSVTGEAVVSSRANVSSLHYVFVDRGVEMAKAFIALFGNVLPVMLGPFLLVFAGAGFFMKSQQMRDLRLEAMVLAFAAVQFVLAGLSTYAEPRYIMNVVIAVSLWSARGIALTGAKAAVLERHQWVRILPVGGLIALFGVGLAANILPPLFGRMSYQPVEYRIAGKWMKENLEPALILCRKPQVGFYADMPSTGPAPRESVPEIVQRAYDAGARYLVVDERYSVAMIPSLEALLDPANAPDGLRLLKADLSPYPAARIVIYEVVPQ
jgi:4-amino-4-deoxy-L-arabinose transferase-like glycosyltransferase